MLYKQLYFILSCIYFQVKRALAEKMLASLYLFYKIYFKALYYCTCCFALHTLQIWWALLVNTQLHFKNL